MPITLYDLLAKHGVRYSPYGWRVRFALAHKGLEAAQQLHWHSDARTLTISGQNLVPVLVDGPTVVSDSWKIACYLDDTYSDRPALMEGKQGKALARFLNVWTDGSVGRVLVRSMYLDIFNSLHPSVDAAAFRRKREQRAGTTLEVLRAGREQDLQELHRQWTPLEELLTHQDFIAGTVPAYADYIVLGTLQMPRYLNGVEVLSGRPAMAAWRDRMRRLFDGLADVDSPIDNLPPL